MALISVRAYELQARDRIDGRRILLVLINTVREMVPVKYADRTNKSFDVDERVLVDRRKDVRLGGRRSMRREGPEDLVPGGPGVA